MKPIIYASLSLIFVSNLAHAYKAGDTLQFVGEGKDGPCAIQVAIGLGHNLDANEEFLEKVHLYTTFNNDHYFSRDSGNLSLPKIVTMKESVLHGRYFKYESHESNPDGLGTEFTSSSLYLYGSSLSALKKAEAKYSLGHTFTTTASGKFNCKKLQAVSPKDFEAAVHGIKELSEAQRNIYEAAVELKEKQEMQAEADAKAKAELKEEQKAADLKAQGDQAKRDEPARRAAIDAERVAKGLSPIDWSKDDSDSDVSNAQ
ncbi:MAG: hypothetical protein ACXWR1_08210 [Bdellovibrionota bacterium]